MLNLFAAYADEEEAEVQMMESRPSPGRTASASRKRKGNEPEMFNLFSQENMYDEAVSQEEMTGEQAAAEAKWQERKDVVAQIFIDLAYNWEQCGFDGFNHNSLSPKKTKKLPIRKSATPEVAFS